MHGREGGMKDICCISLVTAYLNPNCQISVKKRHSFAILLSINKQYKQGCPNKKFMIVILDGNSNSPIYKLRKKKVFFTFNYKN